MKKVLIVTYSLGLGGSELNAYKITQIMKESTFDWYCLDMSRADIKPMVKAGFNINQVVNLNYKTWHNLTFLRNLSNVIKKNKYTTVYAVGFMPSLIIALIKLIFRIQVKLISTRREMMPWKRLYHIPFIGIVNLVSDSIETNSRSIYNDLRENFFLKRKVYYLPNITLSPSKHVKMDVFDEASVYVGTVANVREAKNIKLFLAIAKKMIKSNDQLMFVIAGKDNNHLVTNFIATHNLQGRLSIFEDVKYQDINKFYSGLDLFLFTSIYEGSPNALFEAVSHGLPVVASDIVATREVIMPNDNGFLVDLNHPDEFIVKINLILDNCSLRTAIIENNRRKSLEICGLKDISRILNAKFV